MKKKLLTLVLALSLALGTTVTAYAKPSPEGMVYCIYCDDLIDEDAIDEHEASCPMNVNATSRTYNASGTHTTTVTASISSSYSVILPTSLALSASSGTTYTGNYDVKCKAYLKNTQYVSVTPGTLELVNTSNSSTKATATITQKTNFRNTVNTSSTDVAVTSTDYATTTGNVSVSLPVAGDYSGNLVFTFSLKND